jgi:hypothetical protein
VYIYTILIIKKLNNMEIRYNKRYLLDDLELQLKRKNENVYTFNVMNKEMTVNIYGNVVYNICIISKRINELKLKS